MKYSLLALLVCFLISCDSETKDPENPDKTVDLAELRQEIATHLTNDLILPAFEELNQKSLSLSQAAISFKNDMNEDNLAELSTKHQDLWICWQRTSLYYFGPTVNNALRASLNTYPTDEEKIENNIATGSYQLGSLENQDAEGLPALDYLLNSMGEIEPLSDFSAARLDYIAVLASSIQNHIATTNDAWNNGEFIQTFSGTNATGTDVGSALGLIVNGIDLHFQRFVRDGKVAIPAGLRSAGVPRPQSVEVPYGKYSTSLLKTALVAYQDYFNGKSFTRNDGPSLLAYLRQIDQADLADRIDNHFTILLDKVEQLDPSIIDQIETDNEALIDVFLSMQDLVAIFKSDMASVMGISITNLDNDGD